MDVGYRGVMDEWMLGSHMRVAAARYVCMTPQAMRCSNLHTCLMLPNGGCGGGAWWWWGRCGGIDAKVT